MVPKQWAITVTGFSSDADCVGTAEHFNGEWTVTYVESLSSGGECFYRADTAAPLEIDVTLGGESPTPVNLSFSFGNTDANYSSSTLNCLGDNTLTLTGSICCATKPGSITVRPV